MRGSVGSDPPDGGPVGHHAQAKQPHLVLRLGVADDLGLGRVGLNDHDPQIVQLAAQPHNRVDLTELLRQDNSRDHPISAGVDHLRQCHAEL